MKVPSTYVAPAAPTVVPAAPVITGIAGTHARAGAEGTTLRTASRIQAGNYVKIATTVIVVLAILWFGYNGFTKGGSGTIPTLGELGKWAILAVFLYGGYHKFKSPDAILPMKFFTSVIVLLILLGAISYVFGPTAIPNLHQSAKNWAEGVSNSGVARIPEHHVKLVNGKTYEATPDAWTVWTKKLGKCPGVYDSSGLEIVNTTTVYRFRSLDGVKNVKAFEIGLGESLPGYPNIVCVS